jgi:MFS superfamily sulfate permease-like transporter
MIKPETFRAIARVRSRELVWALVTVAGVLVFGTLRGILIAVAVSMLNLLYQANHPAVYALAYCRGKDIFRRAGAHPGDETFAGLLMVRAEGRLTFANAANARDKVQALVRGSEARVVVLECSAILDIEYTALLMLTEAEENLRARGASLWLVAVNPDLLEVIQRTPLGAALGRERMFVDLHKALAAFRSRGPEGRAAQPEGETLEKRSGP